MSELQFDLALALNEKDEGIASVCASHEEFVKCAREVAVVLATRHGHVTADMLREVLAVYDIEPQHYNAWGSVFKDSRLEWSGEFRTSRLVQGHGNQQRVWVLRRSER